MLEYSDARMAYNLSVRRPGTSYGYRVAKAIHGVYRGMFPRSRNSMRRNRMRSSFKTAFKRRYRRRRFKKRYRGRRRRMNVPKSLALEHINVICGDEMIFTGQQGVVQARAITLNNLGNWTSQTSKWFGWPSQSQSGGDQQPAIVNVTGGIMRTENKNQDILAGNFNTSGYFTTRQFYAHTSTFSFQIINENFLGTIRFFKVKMRYRNIQFELDNFSNAYMPGHNWYDTKKYKVKFIHAIHYDGRGSDLSARGVRNWVYTQRVNKMISTYNGYRATSAQNWNQASSNATRWLLVHVDNRQGGLAEATRPSILDITCMHKTYVRVRPPNDVEVDENTT